jgi:pyruvate kinase
VTTPRRTKIVCTIGPASASPEMLERLVKEGMDVARLNFSHGTHEEHAAVIRHLREGEARWGRPVTILQDLQGPKIRLGTFRRGRVELERGALLTLVQEQVIGDVDHCSLSHPEYLKLLKPGDQIWMDDGMIQLRVESASPAEVRCRVTEGGIVSDHKGVSLPRVPLPSSSLTAKDQADLEFGIDAGVDFVAISFVRAGAANQEGRGFLRSKNANVPIVAKLERAEIVANLVSILHEVDGVMVARGDLGVEVPLEEVPVIQKEVIRQARQAKVPVIVATQMLESMIGHVRPTRAEVSDVATAVFDGVDAVMLSAETASGRYPAETVAVMARIAERAEAAAPRRDSARRRRQEAVGFAQAICDAATLAARDVRAKAIVAFTQLGTSARLISQERPDVPIIALTPSVEVQRRLGLCWGVTARQIERKGTTDDLIAEIDATLLRDGSVQAGDVLVVIAGAPMWVTGTTNLLKLHRVGERL